MTCTRALWAAALAAAGTICWAGCGSKSSGDEDTTVDVLVDAPDGGDAADDTTLDTASDVPLDTAADTTADTFDDPGADTSADVVEDATGDADAPDAADCVPDGVTGSEPTDATAACARIAACIDPDDPAGVAGQCLTFGALGGWQPLYGTIQMMDGLNRLWQVIHGHADDVAGAADCDAAFQVLNGGTPSSSCTLTSASLPAWPTGCRGDDQVFCVNVDPSNTDGREVLVPCFGTTACQTIVGVLSGCFHDDCSTAEDEASCVDGDIDQCVMPGRHLVIDCDEMSQGAGGVCGMVDDGSGGTTAGCRPLGTECDETSFTNTCSGTELTRCAEGHEYTTDCTDIDAEADWECAAATGECVPDLASWACTTPRGGICDCDDLIFCDVTVGEDVRIHCPDYGLRTCEVGADGAMCVP
jgi:hypothetical protein